MKSSLGTRDSSQLISSICSCSFPLLPVTLLVFFLGGKDAPGSSSPVFSPVLLEAYKGEIKGSVRGCSSLVTFIIFLLGGVDAPGSTSPLVFAFVLLEAYKGEIKDSVRGCSFLVIFLVFLLGGDDVSGSTPAVFTLGLLIL